MQIERMTTIDAPGPRLRQRANCRRMQPGTRHGFRVKSIDVLQSPSSSLQQQLLQCDEPSSTKQNHPGPPKKPANKSDRWALFAHADRTDYALMTAGLLAALVSGSTLPVINIVFANAVTAMSNPAYPPHNVDMAGVISCVWALVGIAVWILVSEFLCIALLTHSAARQTRVMREAVLSALVHQELAWFDTTNPFSLSSDISSTMVVIQDGLGRKLGQFVKHSTQVLLAMSVGIQRGYTVGLLIAAVLPIFLVSIYVFVSSVSKATDMETDEYSQAAAVAEEALTSMPTVTAYNAQPSILARFQALLLQGEPIYRQLSRKIALGVAVIQFLSFVLYGYGLWVGGRMVAANDAVVPTMAKALPAIFVEITGLLAIGMAAPAMEALAGARAAAAYILELESQQSAIDSRQPTQTQHQNHQSQTQNIKGALAFHDVVFAYPTRSRDLVLKTCCFSVLPGQRVALVGASGSGKSTVISLLARLYDPAFGRVTMDGTDVRSLPAAWLRAQLGIVRQQPVLFATSVLENVRFGRPSATDAEVVAACKLAWAHGFVTGLPEGYATDIGANGSLLSVGQRQRLAIARAVVKNPRVLLLDEATVALDPASEALVQRAFDELLQSQGKETTALVIAHRLETIAKADVVMVMEDGRVTEQGAYAALRADPRSRYCALFGVGANGSNEQERLTEVALLQSSRFRQRRHQPAAAAPTSNKPTGSFFHASQRVVELASPAAMLRETDGDIALLESVRSSFGFKTMDRVVGAHEADGSSSATTATSSSVHSSSTVGPHAATPTSTPTPTEKPASVVRRILALAAETKPWLATAVVTSLFNGVANTVIVVLRADMINDLYRIEATQDDAALAQAADKYLYIFLALGGAMAVSAFAQSYTFRLLGRRLVNQLRSLTLASMLRQDVAWFAMAGHSAGALSGMLANDTAAVKIIAGEIQGRKTQNVVVIAMALALSLAIGSWQIALVFLAIVAVIVATIVLDQRVTWERETQGDRTLASAGRIANQLIHNVRTITEHNLQATILAEYRVALELPTRVAIKTGYSSALAIAFSQAVKWVGYGVLDYAGAVLIQRGATDFAAFYRSFNLANVSAMCIDETALFVADEKAATVAAQRIFDLMDHTPTVDVDASGGAVLDGGLALELRLQCVDFAYAGSSSSATPVLRQLSLCLPRHQLSVVMGASDGGKSTLLRLLTRVYDADSGAVLVDGTNIRDLDVRWLRATVAVVHQQPVLFRLSVLENIQLGLPTATLQEVAAACEAADAHAFVAALPEGYATLVDSDKFARGQQQRLALARALLRRPRALLLDEATTALDQQSCARVVATLTELVASRACTVVAVTQAELLVEAATNVVVMEAGRVVENGTAQQLERQPHSRFTQLMTESRVRSASRASVGSDQWL